MSPAVASPRAHRREEILAAALAAFTEKGFATTTIDDVRRRSGASVGSIYHHFGGKEGLAGALYVDGLRDYQEGFARELRRRSGAEAKVKAVVRHHLRWVARNRDLAAFLLGRRETEVRLASEASVRELNRAFFGEVSGLLEPHYRMGELRRLPTDLFSSVLVGPSQEFARHWLAGRTRTSIKTAERALADAAWRALQAKGA
jgi:AcrR family transcriptional regulator